MPPPLIHPFKYWDLLWINYGNGPDWITETDSAKAKLDEWRSKVLQHKKKTAIANCMKGNQTEVFISFGKHTVEDFIHEQELFPGTPAYHICRSKKEYSKFKQGCEDYMRTWVSPKFLNGCSGIPNSPNPFAYNYKSAENYLGGYMKVFRHRSTWVDRGKYNRMLLAGLLDPEHVIGTSFFLLKFKLNCYLIPALYRPQVHAQG